MLGLIQSSCIYLQVYSREEMELLAELCIKHDVIVFADEVYEWMVYDNSKHIKIGELMPLVRILLYSINIVANHINGESTLR